MMSCLAHFMCATFTIQNPQSSGRQYRCNAVMLSFPVQSYTSSSGNIAHTFKKIISSNPSLIIIHSFTQPKVS